MALSHEQDVGATWKRRSCRSPINVNEGLNKTPPDAVPDGANLIVDGEGLRPLLDASASNVRVLVDRRLDLILNHALERESREAGCEIGPALASLVNLDMSLNV